ncbi:MAG: archaellin/type IV pilin N-terminal domain-containing protein [Candidatus Aenigmatarchaeota archaeon]
MKFDVSEKGISPLIAAVILIAFVIAVANFVGPWFLDYVEGRTEEVTERDDIDCAYAGLYIRGVQTNGNLTVEVENIKDTEISNFQTETTHVNGSISHQRPEGYNKTLRSGARRTFTVDPAWSLDNVTKIRFYSEDCPSDATDEMDSSYFS